MASSFGLSSKTNVEFRADLCWWATFLDGVLVITALCHRPIDAKLTTDALGSGAFFGNASHESLVLAGQKCTSPSRSCCLLSSHVLFGVNRCRKVHSISV